MLVYEACPQRRREMISLMLGCYVSTEETVTEGGEFQGQSREKIPTKRKAICDLEIIFNILERKHLPNCCK
eukprot:m.29153 g.29153  ORF g.29153 m.29153 type:complete len:71 (-) comp14286_c1_seq1:89-301(-)